MNIGKAHGVLYVVGAKICNACGAEEGSVVPHGAILAIIASGGFGFCDEGVAEFIRPVRSPVGNNGGVSQIRLGVVVNKLGDAKLA